MNYVCSFAIDVPMHVTAPVNTFSHVSLLGCNIISSSSSILAWW